MALLLFHLVKSKRIKGIVKKNLMMTLVNSKLNGQFACHGQKGLVSKGGFFNVMKCRVCSLIENKEKIVGCKWDTLTKQQISRIVVKDMQKLGVKKVGNTLHMIMST
jgi:hypothetical protein